jgi:hypothetical protein
MIISVPFPGEVSTSMIPPIKSMMLLVMDSPRPVPSTPLMVEVDSRSKALNILSANAFDIPMPLS